MGPYETARIADLANDRGWSPIRKHFDIRAFGINAATAAVAGGELISEHDEVRSGHEEVYVVLEGRATFTLDGEEVDAPAATLVYVPDPATRRGATARAPGTTVLAVGGKPGDAFSPRAWETNVEAFPLFERGEYAEVKRVLSDELDRYDDREVILYNLACAEARLGETEAAIEHLRESLAARPDFADLAREDEDLESLRDDPRFGEIVR